MSKEKTAALNDVETEVNVVVSKVTDKTKDTNAALHEDKKSQINDEKLIKTREEILLSLVDRAEVVAENKASKTTDEDTARTEKQKKRVKIFIQSLQQVRIKVYTFGKI